jgi:hypothetical protein
MSRDTKVVTQNKKQKTAALELTFFLFFFSSILSFLFFLPFFLFLQQQYNDKQKLWNKLILESIEYLEQPQARTQVIILAANNVVTNYVTRTQNSYGLNTKTGNTTRRCNHELNKH